MTNKSITIVTCFYKIPSKHSNEEYERWIDNFLKNSNFNIIIFTSESLINYFKKYNDYNKNLYLIIKEFENIRIYKEYYTIWDYQHYIDPQKNNKTKHFYIICNSKLDFLKEAIELNPFKNDKFIWNDIGTIRENNINLNNYPQYNLISDNKIDIVLIKDFNNDNQKYFQNEVHFSGSIFGSSSKNLIKFHKLYYDKFDEYLKNGKFIGCDQQLISSIYLENKDLFNVIKSNDMFYLLKYYNINNNLSLDESKTKKKYAVFIINGRLGNAVFRYFACALFCIKYNYEYICYDDLNNINEYFTFYHGADYIGNDIDRIEGDINNVIFNTINDINIKGFNTFGYLKNKIDINNLTSNEFINKNTNHGLYVKNCINITDNNFFYYFNNGFNKDDTNKNIIFSDYYQFDEFYLSNKKDIINFIKKNNHYVISYNEKIYMNDLLNNIKLDISKIYDISIHIRLDDFNGRVDFIEYEYYIKLFERIKDTEFKNKKIAIVIDKIRFQNDAIYLNILIDFFNKNNIKINIESNDLMTDFNIMKQSKVLICCMSTLSWCAAYLSEKIEKCYIPNYNFYGSDRDNTYFKKPIENTVFYDVKTTKFKNIKAIILTLKDFTIRSKNIENIKNILNKIGIQYEIFYGVNGKNIKIYDTENDNIKLLSHNNESYYYDKRVRLNGQIMGMGELGCGWSHLNIYKKLLNDSNYDNYLIFEDDATLVDATLVDATLVDATLVDADLINETILNKNSLNNLYNLLNNLPNEYDVLHIAKSDCYNFIKKEKVNEYFYKIEKQFFNRLTSYIISKEGANRLLICSNNSISLPCDDLLSNNFLRNNIEVYVPENYVFHEPENTKSITEIINKI